jgi:hypothetical protein
MRESITAYSSTWIEIHYYDATVVCVNRRLPDNRYEFATLTWGGSERRFFVVVDFLILRPTADWLFPDLGFPTARCCFDKWFFNQQLNKKIIVLKMIRNSFTPVYINGI